MVSKNSIHSDIEKVSVQTADEEVLANMGYKPELRRNFSLLSLIGFSFSILTIWTAAGGSLGEIFLNGGPACLVYGIIGCGIMSFFVVIPMADLCSAYPVSGGQYSWIAALTADRSWGRVCSYTCAWMNATGVLGMVAVGLYQIGLMISAMVMLTNDSYAGSNWEVALIAYASCIFALVVDIFGSRIFHYLASVALWLQIIGFIMVFVTVLACAPKFQTGTFVFTQTVNDGWSNVGMAIVVGLQQTAFTFCTYDSTAHLAEEIHEPRKKCPQGMVLSVFIGLITGIAFVLALLFVIQDLDAVVDTKTGYPLLEIYYQATSSSAGADCLLILSLLCQFFTNFSLLTEGSRIVFAIARDGGFPGPINKKLSEVHPTLGTPIYALVFSAVVGIILVSILFGSSAAFFSVMSIASTGLYVSYLMPLVVYFMMPENKAPGYYNLGKWARWVIAPGIVYLTFCLIFFFFPTQVVGGVTGSNMNYCVVAFGVVGIFAVASWFCGARKSYNHTVSLIEGEEIIEELEEQKKKAN